MRRVEKMIIGVQYVAHADIAALLLGAVGDVVIFDVETNAIAAPGARDVFIATLCADSDGVLFVEQSDPIGISQITHKRESINAPSAAKVQDVVIPAIVATQDQVFGLIISDYNDYNYIVNPKRIEFKANAGDTEVEISEGLATAVNSDVSMPNLLADGLTVPGTVTLTGVAVRGGGGSNVINNFRADYEILFNTNLGENLIGFATVTTTTPPDKGCGTFREVRKMEETHKGYKGHLNRVIFPTSVNIQYKSVVGVGYDLLVLEYRGPQYTETEGDVHFQKALTVAIPAGAGTATIDGIIDTL